MAVESVSAAETLIQSTDNDDLEDGEIPSDEDDEPVSCVVTNNVLEATKSSPLKCELTKTKEFDVKFNKNKKQQSPQAASKHDRFLKYNDPSEDWAADVEKAIKAAMQEDGGRNQETKAKNKNNRNKIRKRAREEREDERAKDQKKQKVSEEENPNDDEDEMLFVRGASPVRKDSQERDSPPKHASEHENFEGIGASDHEEKPSANRHKENENKRGNVRSGGGGGSGGRRGGKNERGKNKNRNQGRNDRNNRRQQNNDHSEPDQICVYYMQGKCHRGEDCPFSHNALPPRKMELCKFYLMDCCAKRDKCLYMHHDFPCKFFHTGVKCVQGDNCKFSHKPLNEQVKNILLKHLETAPKEILGDFPRLSRESAMLMINNTARSHAQGEDAANQKIPSLFELKVSEPIENLEEKEEKEEQINQQKGNARERKPSGKKTRWGSDEDRVPYEQIMLLQSANKLGLQLPNAALGLATQQHKQSQDVPNFYTERNAESNVHKTVDDFTKDVGEEIIETERKDIDLRQLLNKKKSSAMSTYYRMAEKMVDLPKPNDEESDQDDELNLIIEMPVEDEDKEKGKHHSNDPNEVHNVYFSAADEAETAPPNLPKKAQELFMRIQQQQRAAQDSFKNLESDSTARRTDQIVEDWYSDDEDDDDDEGGGLTIVDSSKDDVEMAEPVVKTENESTPPSNIPQPAAIVDKLGDLSKIDISAEVSKLLSTLKAQSSTTSSKTQHASKAKSPSRTDGETSSSPRQQSPTSIVMPVSRDPRMSSRDPRQRREAEQKPSSPSIVEVKKEKPLRLETSIYSSGITAMDANMDTDLRTKADQDLRRQDMDFRQRFHTSDFGDTDLRVKSDVDLRQILSLPFKPAPSHVPCTEIDASIASHPPMAYNLYVVDIPRPDYTGLKLTKNDTQVKYDPRLRKIFRISKSEQVADSPMSPPPQQMKQEIPKSPPQCIRSDPRRKTLEAAAASSQQSSQNVMSASMMSKGPMQSMETMGPSMGMQMGPTGIPGSMPGPPQMMGPMGPSHPMSMSNMGPMNHPMGPMMNAGPMPSMGMPPNAPIGMNGPVAMPPQSQMNFDPRFNVQRNNGAGLLGPAPNAFGPDAPFEGGGTSYPSGGNFSSFGPGGSGGPGDPGMMGFNPNASNGPNFGPMAGDGPGDWGTGGNRRGNRIRRRNRNRTNMVTN